MEQYTFIAERVMRTGAVLRELELVIKRCDKARECLKEDDPLRILSGKIIDNIHFHHVEKYGAILATINSWLSVEVKSIEMAAEIIEQENKKKGEP
jgi:hypothetical protein